MQSGTILHLALLKKLSSHYPYNDYHHRFDIFKKQRTTLCTIKSQKHNYPLLNFQKYEDQKENQYYAQVQLYKKKSKPIKKRQSSELKQIWANQDITGWNLNSSQEAAHLDPFRCYPWKATDYQQIQKQQSAKQTHQHLYLNQTKPKHLKIVRNSVVSVQKRKNIKQCAKILKISKQQNCFGFQTSSRRKRIRQIQNGNVAGSQRLRRANSSQEKYAFSMMSERFNSLVLNNNPMR